MAGFTKVFIFGNLTRDPEQRVTAGGLTISKFGVAVSRKFKGQDGSMKEEVTFVDVDAFGRQAELIGQSFHKGNPIFVEGRLRLDQWESNTGEKRSKLTVALENFHYTSSRADAESMGGGDTHSFENSSHEPKAFKGRSTPNFKATPSPYTPRASNDKTDESDLEEYPF